MQKQTNKIKISYFEMSLEEYSEETEYSSEKTSDFRLSKNY